MPEFTISLAKSLRMFAAIGASAIAFAAAVSPASASDVSRDDEEVEINGENDADVITVSTDGVNVTVTDTGPGGATTSDPLCTQVNPTTVTCSVVEPGYQDLVEFDVDFGDGVDSFTNQNMVSPDGRVDGFGTTGAKTVAGGPGQQFIQGGLDSDNLEGGPGDDSIYDGGDSEETTTGGNDLIVGGPGTDFSGYFRALRPVSITLDGAANDGEAGEADNVQVENVATGDGADVVIGDASGNVLEGGLGSDLIRGGGGVDSLVGDFGPLRMIPARGISPSFGGDDTLEGGAGRDELECGAGLDVALREPADKVRFTCERTGAEIVGDNAAVGGKRKNSFKPQVLCPETEGAKCKGKLKASAGGKKLGKGKFSIGAGKTKRAKVKLSKKGAKALRSAGGSLLVTVQARTKEPGGTAVDEDTVFIYR